MNVVPYPQLDRVDQFLRSFTSANTREAYERDLRDYATFSAGADPLTFSTLARYRDALIASVSPATVVRKFSAVKSFLAFLASEGAIPTNPAANLKVPRAEAREHTQAFEDHEVGQVLSQPDVTTFRGSTNRLALVLLFNLGLRRAELVNLRLGSVKEYRGSRYLQVLGKGDKVRLVRLTSSVLVELEAYLQRYARFSGRELQDGDYLLQSAASAPNERPVSPSTVYRMVRACAVRAGVDRRVSPHSCRATVISHLLEKDVSPRAVADLVGHASINTTVGIYDRKRDALRSTTAEQVNYG